MIIIGLVFVALLTLAFAGSALGDPAPKEGSGGMGAILFLLLLAGIVAKHRKAKDDEEF